MPTRPWDVSSSRPPFCNLAGTTLKCPLIYFFFISFFSSSFIEASWINVILTHLPTSFYSKELLLSIWVLYLLGIFPIWLDALLFKYGIRICFHVPYESGLSTLCSDIRGVRVSLPLRHRLDQLHDRRFLRLCLVGYHVELIELRNVEIYLVITCYAERVHIYILEGIRYGSLLWM